MTREMTLVYSVDPTVETKSPICRYSEIGPGARRVGELDIELHTMNGPNQLPIPHVSLCVVAAPWEHLPASCSHRGLSGQRAGHRTPYYGNAIPAPHPTCVTSSHISTAGTPAAVGKPEEWRRARSPRRGPSRS